MSWHLQSVTDPDLLPRVFPRGSRIHTFSANSISGLILRLNGNEEVPAGPLRLAIVDDTESLAARCSEAAALLSAGSPVEGWLAPNIVFHEAMDRKKIAFVFTGAAAAYQEMGRSLLRELPALLMRISQRAPHLVRSAGWMGRSDTFPASPQDQFIGSTLLSQIHRELTCQIFNLSPDAVIGVSSGETNALMAVGLWPEIDSLIADVQRSQLFERHLAGQFLAVRSAWSQPQVSWENWVIVHEVAEVRQLVAGEDRVFITVIYTDQHCVISGDSAACRRVIEAVGAERAIRQPFEVAAHCTAVAPYADEWQRIHTRETAAMPGETAIYSNNSNAAYPPTSHQIGNELTGQLLKTVNLPDTIRKAWDDGIRVFVEHGPRDTLSKAIGTILKGKPHVGIALDVFGACAVTQAAKAAAELWSIGAGIDIAKISPPVKPASGLMSYPIRWKPISVGGIPLNRVTSIGLDGGSFVMSPPRIDFLVAGNSVKEWAPQHLALRIHERARAAQSAYVNHQIQCHRRYHEFLRATLAGLRHPPTLPDLSKSQTPASTDNGETAGEVVPRPLFNRQDLIGLASGKISHYFGPRFKQQDDFPIQVRMPEPPLLLCDRVTRIEGEPGVLAAATIWTETDVRQEWYLHNGRMAPCAVIESGQADLLLISWLGIDFENKGKRAYRLLGSQVTFHRELPRPGETLQFEIRITGYARQGEVRIFFFDYDCLVNGTPLISVRRGHAGFFTKEELAQSKGVLWNPAEAKYSAAAARQLPAVRTRKHSFSAAEVQAFAAGNLAACFGANFVPGSAHLRTPRIQGGEQTFIGEILELDFAGGPCGRGYARAAAVINPQAWYFTGHFRNDPCMPGTLMAEGCMQLMSFYLAAAGCTLDRDGWRFEPVIDKMYPFLCRGQVVPSSRELVFELFVDELHCDPWPHLRAHALATVDGIKALLCEGLEVRLVPEAPETPVPAPSGRMAEASPSNITVAPRNQLGQVPPLKTIFQHVKLWKLGAIELGVAMSESEVHGCHTVISEVFVTELGQTLDHRYQADTIHVYSRDAERVFGTISITSSGPVGLPLERSVPMPPGYSREDTVQFSKLAILKSYRGKQNYQILIGEFAIGLLREIQKLGYRSLILESILSPMHQAFYKMLGLKIIGAPYRYAGWPDRVEPNHILMGNSIDDCLAGSQAHFAGHPRIDRQASAPSPAL